jgi:hypothetical protein
MDSTPSDRARRVPPSVPQALEHGKLRRGCELRKKWGRVPSSRNIDTQDEERRRRVASSPLSVSISIYLEQRKERGGSANRDAGETVFQSAGTFLEQGGTLEQR